MRFDLEKCNFRKLRSPVTLNLDWVKVISASYQQAQYIYDYQHTRPCDCSLKQYGSMALWISCNIDIPKSLKSCDSFLGRKLENRALTSYELGLILSRKAISFELHTKMAEETDLEKCNFRKFRILVTLTLDRVKVTSACTVQVGLPTCLTMWM